MYPDILVMRHGETEWNRVGRMQGWMDSPLTDFGMAQAQQQKTLLVGLDFSLSHWMAYSSPQPRALHTAAIALSGSAHNVQTDERLREIDVGDWAGLQRDVIKDRVAVQGYNCAGPLDHYDHTPGENFDDLHSRCRAFLDHLTGPALIFTHGITSRMLRVVALDMPVGQLADVAGGQGNILGVIGGQSVAFDVPGKEPDGDL